MMTDYLCPALADLFADPREKAVERHLLSCPRCAALVAAGAAETQVSSAAFSDPRIPKVELAPQPEPPASPDRGIVALFSAEDSDLQLPALILDRQGPLLLVAPISAEVAMASEWDLLLPAATLSYPAMASIAGVHPIRREQLLGTRAVLGVELWQWAQRLVELHDESQHVPAEAPVGVPVLSEIDLRLAFHRDWAASQEPFWAPAELLGEAETFGALVHRRREQLNVSAADLGELVERPGWLERLEGDRLNINSELPTQALVALMRELKIRPLGVVIEQLRAAIEARVSGVPQRAVFARRRTTVRRAGANVPPAEREQIAEAYVRNVLKALGER
jgi:anti-sigma factor RsiW